MAVGIGCGKARIEPGGHGGNGSVTGGTSGAGGHGGNSGFLGLGGTTGDGGPGACAAGKETSLTGTVYAPNGTLPIYNALVYVPRSSLAPFPSGLSCDRCGALPPGEPVTAALTDAHGEFTLKSVPAGTNVPLVIQVGKWRRQVRVPSVPACQSTKITDHELTRLPRNRQEGDLPRIAVTTGTCDNLICLLPKVGIDPAEWGIAGEGRPLTFYRGFEKSSLFPEYPQYQTKFDTHLQKMTSASNLWGDFAELSQYDMVVLSCECSEYLDNKGPPAYDAVTRYLTQGGRVFSSDFQYVWYKYSTDPKVGTVAVMNPQSHPLSSTETKVRLDTSSPKGKALADWYATLSSTTAAATIECRNVYDNFSSITKPGGQVWGSSVPDSPSTPSHPTFFSFNTPVGVPAEQQCGRAVHVDAHIVDVLTPSGDLKLQYFPDDCGSFSPGESVLAFFLFDAAACVQDDIKEPVPPIIY